MLIRARRVRCRNRTAWSVVIRARGSRDRALLEVLGDTPTMRATLSRITRTPDELCSEPIVVAELPSEAAGRALTDALARAGAIVELV
jgi:hypothetical protein